MPRILTWISVARASHAFASLKGLKHRSAVASFLTDRIALIRTQDGLECRQATFNSTHLAVPLFGPQPPAIFHVKSVVQACEVHARLRPRLRPSPQCATLNGQTHTDVVEQHAGSLGIYFGALTVHRLRRAQADHIRICGSNPCSHKWS